MHKYYSRTPNKWNSAKNSKERRQTMKTPLVSVIVPVYNAEKYLRRCIYSILKNTYPNLEVLCINDGSTDNSEKILHEIAREDSRLKVFSQPNKGVSAARNYGLDKAKGDFVAFIDADDWIHKNYFEYLIQSCKTGGASIAVCKYRSVGDEISTLKNEAINYKMEAKLSVRESFENSFIKTYVWGRVIDHKIIGNIRFETGMTFGEDTTFMLKLLCEHPDIYVNLVDNILYYYYQKSEFTGRFSESTGYLPMIDAYSNYIGSLGLSDNAISIIIEEAIKKLFVYRYEAGIEQKYNEAKYNFSIRFQILKKYLGRLSLKKRIVFSVLAFSPSLYRLMRITSDQTMLDWEKQKQELIRKQQNKSDKA